MYKQISFAFILFLIPFFSGFAWQPEDTSYHVKTPNLTVRLSGNGEITEILLGPKKIRKPVNAFTEIAECRVEGKVAVQHFEDGSIEFTKVLINDSLRTSCTLTERFIPTENSIRWEFSITGKDIPWGSIIRSRFKYPVIATTKFWTTWGSPQYDKSTTDSKLSQMLHPIPTSNNKNYEVWSDPLIPLPFADTRLFYGSPYMSYKEPRQGYWAKHGDVFSIPMCSVLEGPENSGLTIALSPEDNLINMVMHTEEDGTFSFSRLHNRITKDRPVKFALDLVAGESDWRGGINWMSKRYPEYFNPKTPDALKFGGTGAYSNHFSAIDVKKLKKMAFTVNWQASYDFPYMGMFLPPVKPDEKWKTLDNRRISITEMNDYAGRMKDDGFYVLNYFNVTEFGNYIKYPLPVSKTKNPLEDWKDPHDFLSNRLSNAILKVPERMIFKNLQKNIKHLEGAELDSNGRVFYTWRGGLVMDCGDPAYQAFILEQARRHIEEIPNSFGICIDRIDWLRFFNEQADDGISWFEGKPVRSLFTSWKQLLTKLDPLMHDAGKSILLNTANKRIDIMKNVDGQFDEFTYSGPVLNTTAFMSVNKPALGWTNNVSTIKEEGVDKFFQKYLYMGVYPMAPFPGNDHAVTPDPLTDKFYLDYGPLMVAMKERRWLLEPHAVSVKDNAAKANIFAVPEGLSIPVVFAQKGITKVEVTLRNADRKNLVSCLAYHPGKEKAVQLTFKREKNNIIIDVPVERGCAMVLVKTKQ